MHCWGREDRGAQSFQPGKPVEGLAEGLCLCGLTCMFCLFALCVLFRCARFRLRSHAGARISACICMCVRVRAHASKCCMFAALSCDKGAFSPALASACAWARMLRPPLPPCIPLIQPGGTRPAGAASHATHHRLLLIHGGELIVLPAPLAAHRLTLLALGLQPCRLHVLDLALIQAVIVLPASRGGGSRSRARTR